MDDPSPGWYVIIRESDGAIACLRRLPKRWGLQYGRPFERWWLGPRVDDLLVTAAWADVARHLLTPAQLAMIEVELAAKSESDG